jgi:hypothetical protein
MCQAAFVRITPMTQIPQIHQRSRSRPKAGLETESRDLKNESSGDLILEGLILSGLAIRSAALRAARERSACIAAGCFGQAFESASSA